MTPCIQQKDLCEVLTYFPLTGEFIWAQRPKNANRINIGGVAGHQSNTGYTQIRLYKYLYYAHRLAFLYMTGVFPLEQVDHINGDPSDTRWSNLRLATPTENQRNTAISKNNTSGVLGVCWDKRKSAWLVRIRDSNKEKFIGYFKELADAAIARKAAEQLYGYHPNHGRISI